MEVNKFDLMGKFENVEFTFSTQVIEHIEKHFGNEINGLVYKIEACYFPKRRRGKNDLIRRSIISILKSGLNKK